MEEVVAAGIVAAAFIFILGLLIWVMIGLWRDG